VAEPTPETPRRALLKSADVCEIIKVQPYVLRSWEKEFPDLGSTRTAGGPRFYRQADVERVQRLKQLVFGEGLTIAGARRRLEEERGTPEADELPFDDEPVSTPVSADMRERIEGVRHALRALLDMLSAAPPRSAEPPSAGVNGDAAPAPEPIPRGRAPKRRRAETAVNE
jgi:DNA-binding transcriptional MerR regulator